MINTTKQEFKNPKQVRAYLAKVKREYRERKKLEKLEAAAPACKQEATAATTGAVTND